MSIVNLLEQIKNDEIVLPAIQRNFVWSEDQVEKLLDSIMREYPIGIALLWEAYEDIQYRPFVKDYKSGSGYIFRDNRQHRRLKLVLDGQQRLQSLYTAMYGTHKGKYMYFDVLSGRETEDFKEDKFFFYFLDPKDADEWNELAIVNTQRAKDEKSEDYEAEYYCRVQDLLKMGPRERQRFERDLAKTLGLSEEDQLRLDLNLKILRDAFFTNANILKATVIDENKPRESRERKKESDVLEAFFRINREGTRLTRSDLIFSLIKLSWKESAKALPDFVDEINKGNSFELDSDFVIRCLFVVSDLGSKFDVDILRKKGNVDAIRKNFAKCCNAIRSTVDFVQNECWIASSRLLGGARGYYNLVPLAYYLFHTKDHQVPNSEIDRVRKALYLLGFTRPFSRYADSRLGKVIREEFKPLVLKHDDRFPLEDCLYWIWYWERIENYGPQLLQGNPSLALHLVQHRSGARVHYEKNAPQVDHIFPRSVLREKGYDEAEINHFANLWILAKNKNQNKGNKHPAEYFGDVSDSELQRAYIDRNLLDYRRYKTFLRKRAAQILEHVKEELKLSETDFDVRAHWDIE